MRRILYIPIVNSTQSIIECHYQLKAVIFKQIICMVGAERALGKCLSCLILSQVLAPLMTNRTL